MDVIVEKRLRWYKTETILLWLMIAMAVIPIPTGIGIYLYVDTLTITQYISAITAGNIAVSQVRMLCHPARGLGLYLLCLGLSLLLLSGIGFPQEGMPAGW